MVGIDMSTAKELIIKVGRKNVGINNKVWIRKTVTQVSNYSSLGNQKGISALVYSSYSYDNFIDKLEERNLNKDVKRWFTYHSNKDDRTHNTARIIKAVFDDWISNGIKD